MRTNMRASIILWLFCVVMFGSAGSLSVQAAVDETGYDEAVVALQNAGVIDGARSGDVRLFDPVNRAETLKVILRAQTAFASEVRSVSTRMPGISLFPDVNQQAWYAPYVEIGFSHKLVTGYPDGRFRPELGVKTEEAAAMLVRAFGSQGTQFLTSQDLPNEEGQWYSDAVSALIARGAIRQGSNLRIGYALTRGQMFDLVYLMSKTQSGIPVATTVSPVQTPQVPVDGDAAQYLSAKEFALSIPSLGITDLTVTHPADPYSSQGVLAPLKEGVGHLFAYPGEGSKIMVYGHSSGYPWDLSQYTQIFRTINKIKVGHRVYITYKGKLYVYEVTAKNAVTAKDRSPFEPDQNGEELILYTCWPPDSISQRFLVHAVPVRTTVQR